MCYTVTLPKVGRQEAANMASYRWFDRNFEHCDGWWNTSNKNKELSAKEVYAKLNELGTHPDPDEVLKLTCEENYLQFYCVGCREFVDEALDDPFSENYICIECFDEYKNNKLFP